MHIVQHIPTTLIIITTPPQCNSTTMDEQIICLSPRPEQCRPIKWCFNSTVRIENLFNFARNAWWICVCNVHILEYGKPCVSVSELCVCVHCTVYTVHHPKLDSVYLSIVLALPISQPKNVLCLNVNYAVLILFSTTSCFSVQSASKQESKFNIHIWFVQCAQYLVNIIQHINGTS